MKVKNVRPGLKESYEGLFHSLNMEEFMLLFRANDPTVEIDRNMVNLLNEQTILPLK